MYGDVQPQNGVVDDSNSQELGIEVNYSLLAPRVARALDWIIEWRGVSLIIRCDNALEYVSQLRADWAERRRNGHQSIPSGKPQ